MNVTACYHRASDNYCYARTEDELIINLKTGYDVTQVYLHYGDPFAYGILGGKEGWQGERATVFYRKHLSHQVWWTTTVKPPFKRLKYYFELHTQEGVFFYLEDGIFTKEQMEVPGKSLQCFTFPWMNPADIAVTPNWVNETIWYQIFPERFCNGDTSNDPKNTLPWHHGPVRNEEFYGGDLAGIKSKLPYLHELGINGIYLTPIFEATTAHKYDTTDYLKIDPQFGTNEEFKELVSQAHKLGIRIMVDGVFNHSGRLFGPWQDVLKHGPKSKYYDWFMVREWPFDQSKRDTRDGKFYSFAFTSLMPKLNTNNEAVISYLLDICETWVREFDIDGIRLDVANELSHQFNKALRKRMRMLKPDFYLLGEIWHDAMHWLRGDEYDSVMNYPLTSSIQDFFIDKKQTKLDFEYTVNRCYTLYMTQQNDVLFNLLDSHDTKRLRNAAGTIDIFYQQLALLFTMPGSPCIYYGTEVALEGEHDPDCRRCMPWDEIETGKHNENLHLVRSLIALRKTEPCLRSSYFHFPNLLAEQRVIEYIKLDENGQEIEVLLNCSDAPITIADDKQVLWQRLYHKKQLAPGGVVVRK